jgi:serine/threonine-protein kinase
MSESAAGKSIGPYQLVEVIDDSGNAVLCKGFQPSTNRYVALKVLKPHAARNAAKLQQFKQQGELIAGMQHPNILPVYDMGQDQGVSYQVSRFVEGGSLRDHLAAYTYPSQAQGLFDGIAAGLEYIHSQGYVHGNLAPANVLLDEPQRPLLTDFGLPKPPGAAPTPYMSPEQVAGGAVDSRTDVYALGVLLYEVLVGQTPPTNAPVSLQASRPDLPGGVEKVVLKALAQNPDDRFQTVIEFQSGLDAALRPAAPAPPPQRPVATTPPAPTPAPVPQPEPGRGDDWPAIILGGLLVVAVIALAIFIVQGIGEETVEAPPPTEDAPAATAPPAQDAPAVEAPTAEPAPTEAPTAEPAPTEAPTAEPAPTEAPTAEEAPPTEPAEEAPPAEDDGGSSGLPVCGSIGFAGGLVVYGSVMASRKRRR